MPDSNGTSFHLLLTDADWFDDDPEVPGGAGVSVSGDPPLPDLGWSPARGLGLRGLTRFLSPPGVGRLTFDDRRGADRDRYGVWWVVSADRQRLERFDADGWRVVWPATDAPARSSGPFVACMPELPGPPTLGGLVVTDDHRLVVGCIEPAGLLVFDLVGGGEPVFLDWSDTSGRPFHPRDLTRRAAGGVLVLDPDVSGAQPTRVWVLDHRLQPRGADRPVADAPFRPRDGEPPTAPPRSQPVPWTIDAQRPTAIEALPDGDYVVLETGVHGSVRRYREESLSGTVLDLATALEGVLGEDAASAALDAHDLAILTDAEGRSTAFLSTTGGDQVFAFDIDPQDGFSARVEQYPLRLHHGRALVTAGRQVWFDTERGWHPIRVHGRPRHVPAGVLVTRALDGRDDGCRWHRLLIDGCIPSGTSVTIECRAADALVDLATRPWASQPSPYRRRGGSEQPYDLDRVARGEANGTWETLLQAIDGRYAQLRLTLRGSGSSTPRLVAARVHFPRFSYLHEYLPEVYAERDRTTGFLERYLANPEGLLTELEERIAEADLLFDPASVPAAFLDWLASWLGVVLEPDWDERRRRVFLRHAHELFTQRGTPQGVLRALALAVHDCPERAFSEEDPEVFGTRVVERFAVRRLGAVVPGETTGDAPLLVGTTQRWRSEDGAEELHRRYRTFLAERYASLAAMAAAWGRELPDTSAVRVTPLQPPEGAEARDWQDFLARELGVREPRLGPDDLALYRRHLLQRYRRIGQLVEAHGLSAPVPSSFAAVQFPPTLPNEGAALRDWVDLISRVAPITRSAHRFSVLVAIEPGTADQHVATALARAARVVAVERPAHTAFDIRPYWSAFQLGEVRLGVDTRLGVGARFAALVLDRSRLAEGFLPGPRPRSSLPCDLPDHPPPQPGTREET